MTAEQIIEMHRAALLRLLMTLFVAAGFQPGDAVPGRLTKPVRAVIRRILLPAESAYRRLVLFRSRFISLPSDAPGRRGPMRKLGKRTESDNRVPSFWLFDRRPYYPELSNPRKRPRLGPAPWIWRFDGSDPVRLPKPEKPARHPDDAKRMTRRMLALRYALQDVDKQAKRLLRIMAERAKKPPGPGRVGPVRPGYAPGRRAGLTHEIDMILFECQRLANREPPPDTS